MKRKIAKWLVLVGILLVLSAGGWLIGDLLITNSKQQDTADLITRLDSILPEITEGTLSERGMPVLEIDGEDIVALVEIPTYGVRLPVGSTWNASSVSEYPRCFSGSAYNHTMVIGGSDRKGQLDCLDRVDIGDVVTITDMTGGVFTYEVERVDRADSADNSTLTDSDTDLTLFARDTYSLEYILVRCTAR